MQTQYPLLLVEGSEAHKDPRCDGVRFAYETVTLTLHLLQGRVDGCFGLLHFTLLTAGFGGRQCLDAMVGREQSRWRRRLHPEELLEGVDRFHFKFY